MLLIFLHLRGRAYAQAEPVFGDGAAGYLDAAAADLSLIHISMMLSLVGTSVKQQIAVWFLAATLLSAFLPNTVVAAILCSIAMSMLKFVNEGDLKKSRVAPLVLLAIVWGANNGGLMTPLGGAMNLVTVAYIEELTGAEFIYTDWRCV